MGEGISLTKSWFELENGGTLNAEHVSFVSPVLRATEDIKKQNPTINKDWFFQVFATNIILNFCYDQEEQAREQQAKYKKAIIRGGRF